MKHFFFIILLFSVSLKVSAQNNQGRLNEGNSLFINKGGSFVDKKTVAKQYTPPVYETDEEQQAEKDTASYALYMNSVKQHGWMRGLGKPITDEHAKHLSHYFRFSQKNKAGHWTKVENLNGYGQLENGNMGTYLVNPFDDEDLQIDKNWRKKLKQIVCWELVGDMSGEKCIQENAYDKDGNLVYSYIPVQVGTNKFMGHFVDAWGMPAQLRNEKEAKYVVIKWDDYGYESEVAYIGEDGYPKKNSWGAYIAKYVHDRDGFTISNMSCSADGSYMRDRAGNSGQRQTCDEYGNSIVVTNYDENNEVIRIDSEEDWIQYKIEYDSLGREIRRTYQFTDGTPDTTKDGRHGYELEYNEHGQFTFLQNIDIDGRPANYGKNGYSSIRKNFDKLGNLILFELRDKNGAFWNDKSNCCLQTLKYDGNKLLEQKDYTTTNGRDTILTYHFYRNGEKEINKYYLRNEIDVFVDDQEGDNIEEEYFDLNWNPRVDKTKGYHHLVKLVTHSQGISTTEKKYLDTDGHFVNVNDETFMKYMKGDHNSDVYNHSIETNDTTNLVMTMKYLDGDNVLLQYQQPRSTDYLFAKGEIGMDVMGEKARTHYEKALYYNCYTGRTIKDNYAYLGITNEYDEIAYALESDRDSSPAFAFRPMDGSRDLDENGNEIYDSELFREKLPKAYIVEVFDSVATNMWGIKSGDVIMKYGEWKYSTLSQYSYHGMELYESFFALRDTNKDLVVMRRNSKTNTGEYIIIQLGIGMPKDFGFFVYPIVYTQKEKTRYENCFKSFIASNSTDKDKDYKKTDKGEDVLFFRPLRTSGYRQPLFGRGVISEGIVLGYVVQDESGICERLGHKDLKNNFDRCRQKKDRQVQKIWFTTDLKSIQSVELFGEDSFWGANFWLSDVDIRISRPSEKLYKNAEKMMISYSNQLEKIYLDSLMAKYGIAYKAVDDDSVSIHLGRITGDTGYMIENGYNGLFIVLEWCGWKCIDKNSEFSCFFEKNRKKKKNILLLPVENVDNQYTFGDIIRIKSTKPFLGLRMSEKKISFHDFKHLVLERYIEWTKRTNK